MSSILTSVSEPSMTTETDDEIRAPELLHPTISPQDEYNPFDSTDAQSLFQTPMSPLRPQQRGPPGVVPPSSLYTAVISPKEMAAHEATNFKTVRGVYKNCRGIWAAQWTDERGQRHTKYFNPKYYCTEAEARHEAFKFKVHIAREIELRGGVQKRRNNPGVPVKTGSRGTDGLLEHPYIRQRRPSRAVSERKNRSNPQEVDAANFDFYNSGFFPPGFDPQALILSDYLFRQQQYSSQVKVEELGILQEGSELTNSATSPLSNANSPPQGMFYPQSFDPMYLSAPSAAFSLGNPMMMSTEFPANDTPKPTEEDGGNDGGRELQREGEVVPPGTSSCVCGCGMLAIAPARYAAHHRPKERDDQMKYSQNIALRDSPFISPERKRAAASESGSPTLKRRRDETCNGDFNENSIDSELAGQLVNSDLAEVYSTTEWKNGNISYLYPNGLVKQTSSSSVDELEDDFIN